MPLSGRVIMTEAIGDVYRAHILDTIKDLKNEVKDIKKAQTENTVSITYVKSRLDILERVVYAALLGGMGYAISQLLGLI